MTATVAGIHLGLDTHANRPAANTVPDGSIYSCSTHSLIYKSNFAGNSWATWATLGATGYSGVSWSSGTSMPGSPATNQRVTRTDLDIQDYFYDGTRWRSVDVFEMEATGANASANADIAYRPPFGGVFDLWLVDFGWTYQVTAPHSGTQFWDCVLHKYEAGGGTDTVVTTLVSDKASTIWVNPAATAIGAVLGTTIDLIYFSLVKHSTAGNLQVGARLRYQVIAT